MPLTGRSPSRAADKALSRRRSETVHYRKNLIWLMNSLRLRKGDDALGIVIFPPLERLLRMATMSNIGSTTPPPSTPEWRSGWAFDIWLESDVVNDRVRDAHFYSRMDHTA